MYRAVVLYEMFKPGTTYVNPDNGTRWDLLEPGDEGYENQRVEAFRSGKYALSRCPHDVDMWAFFEVYEGVRVAGGYSEWAVASRLFAEATGEYIPATWQELARITDGR